MIAVTKDGIIMGCQDEIQLAAFLSSGWTICKEEAASKVVVDVEPVLEEEPVPVKKAVRGRPKR